MHRAPGPRRMARDLDRTILAQLKVGKVKRLVKGEVVETDLPASFLELVRKRIKDLGVDRLDPKDPSHRDVMTRLALEKMAREAKDEGELPRSPDEDNRDGW